LTKATPNIRLAPYDPSEAEKIASIWDRAWRSTVVGQGMTDPFSNLLDRFRSDAENLWDLTIARDEDGPAGFCAVIVADKKLDQLFIDPDKHGRGIGSLLLNDCEERSMPGGFWLVTAKLNIQARQFYERHGLDASPYEDHPASGHERVMYRWSP
jgi:putative acetyltransferase